MAGSLHDAVAPGMYHFRCHVTLVQFKVDSCQWEAVSCLEGTIPHRSIHFPNDFGCLKGGSVLHGEVPPDSHWQSGCLTRLASPSAHRKLGAYADGASIGVRSRPSYALQIQREGYHLRWQPQDSIRPPSCDGYVPAHLCAPRDAIGSLEPQACEHYGGKDGLRYELDADRLPHLRGQDLRSIPHLIIYRKQLFEAVHRTVGWDECRPPSVDNYHSRAEANCKSITCLTDLSRSQHQLDSWGAG